MNKLRNEGINVYDKWAIEWMDEGINEWMKSMTERIEDWMND